MKSYIQIVFLWGRGEYHQEANSGRQWCWERRTKRNKVLELEEKVVLVSLWSECLLCLPLHCWIWFELRPRKIHPATLWPAEELERVRRRWLHKKGEGRGLGAKSAGWERDVARNSMSPTLLAGSRRPAAQYVIDSLTSTRPRLPSVVLPFAPPSLISRLFVFCWTWSKWQF